MKAVFMFLAATVLGTFTAAGQGQFVFNNRVPPDIDARFQICTGSGWLIPEGSSYIVQVLRLAVNTPEAQIQSLAITDFRTGNAAGYVNPITVAVPGLGEGTRVDVYLRVFHGTTPAGALLAIAGPYEVTLHVAPALPDNLFLGTSPIPQLPLDSTCPEPPLLSLELLGLSAALWWARANNRVETNRRQALRFSGRRVNSNGNGACVGTSPAAVAHPNR